MIRPLALAVCALALVVTGCGQKKETLGPQSPKPFKLLLDYFPNADHAEIYAAQAAGDFSQAGLDLKIRKPSDPSAPIKQVAAGRVDLAISYEPELLRARDKGLRVISVGALVQKPLTSIISLPRAKIRRPADLGGKTVGTAGLDYQAAYLRTILLEARLRPERTKLRNVGFNLVPALLSKKVDAILGGFWNYEGVDLQLRRRQPRVIRIEQAGVPTYNELVLVANEDALDRDGGRIRAFIAALSRGARALQKDPNRAIQGLLKANPDLDARLQRASVKVTLPTFLLTGGKPFGWQDPGQWDRFTAWMNDNSLLQHTPDAKGAFTNRYLPGAGL